MVEFNGDQHTEDVLLMLYKYILQFMLVILNKGILPEDLSSIKKILPYYYLNNFKDFLLNGFVFTLPKKCSSI